MSELLFTAIVSAPLLTLLAAVAFTNFGERWAPKAVLFIFCAAWAVNLTVPRYPHMEPSVLSWLWLLIAFALALLAANSRRRDTARESWRRGARRAIAVLATVVVAVFTLALALEAVRHAAFWRYTQPAVAALEAQALVGKACSQTLVAGYSALGYDLVAACDKVARDGDTMYVIIIVDRVRGDGTQKFVGYIYAKVHCRLVTLVSPDEMPQPRPPDS